MIAASSLTLFPMMTLVVVALWLLYLNCFMTCTSLVLVPCWDVSSIVGNVGHRLGCDKTRC